MIQYNIYIEWVQKTEITPIQTDEWIEKFALYTGRFYETKPGRMGVDFTIEGAGLINALHLGINAFNDITQHPPITELRIVDTVTFDQRLQNKREEISRRGGDLPFG